MHSKPPWFTMARTRRGWAWAPYASPHPLDPPLKYSSPCLVSLPQPHPWWLFPHKVKGYADDLIVIFTTPQNHQVVLHRLTIDNMRSAWPFPWQIFFSTGRSEMVFLSNSVRTILTISNRILGHFTSLITHLDHAPIGMNTKSGSTDSTKSHLSTTN